MHTRVPLAEANAWLAAVERFLDQNAAAFRDAPGIFAADLADALDRSSRQSLARVRPLLLQRGHMGRVKRGHGDLHLANIVLFGTRPIPFDAIEFDPLTAAGDVLYDLAFLLMDLIERKLNRAANIVLNGYLAQTRRMEDLDALAALPFFMSLRAAIRAKVSAARLPHVDRSAQAGVTTTAQAYFRLAVDLLAPVPPKLIAIGGLSGTGKTSVARELAPAIGPMPGAVVLRSDVERKALFGVAETEHLPAEAYRSSIAEQVYHILIEKAARTVSAGHSAIVDAVFARPGDRTAIANAAHGANVRFQGLFLTSGVQTRIARLNARGLDASDADITVARQQENYDLGQIDWMKINASGSLAETAERARTAVEQIS
jgi:predicted kinase